MAMHNKQIATLLEQMADLLQVAEANRYRIQAYRNAARTINELPLDLATLVHRKENLTQFPGIGPAMAEKIKTIVQTGQLPQLEQQTIDFPPILSLLTHIPGLGPKRVRAIYTAYAFHTLAEFEQLLASGKIRQLPGFGEKIEALIHTGLQHLTTEQHRIPWVQAEQFIDAFMVYLKQQSYSHHIDIAGSYRRKRETVHDIDIVITVDRPASAARVMEHIFKYPDMGAIIEEGTTRARIILTNGLHVDLRVVKNQSYGAALIYFTGSKAHTVELRKMALQQQLKMNEYGIFKQRKRIAGATEYEVYQQLGLPYIEPELREHTGEIEAALRHQLPTLITLQDIRGDLHCHTNATDGQYSLAEMVAAAQARGYEYVAITDHTQHLTIAHGLDVKHLFEQIKHIDQLNEQLQGFTILKASEVDILEDGSLDLPDAILRELDLTVCSIHYKFNLSIERQTQRIIRAMDNPYFKILGHPTGRLIQQREPYAIDIEQIIQAAKDRHCIIELNAQPSRLDFNEFYCHLAKQIGVKIAISSDAHSIYQFDNMRFGVNQARRGWLSVDDVINTRSLSALKIQLKR